LAQVVGVVSFVCRPPLWSGDSSKPWRGDGDIGDVSRGQRKRDWSPAIIGQSMDFARSSAARTAHRFRELPLEPAAERCALTWLLAMESSSGTGPAAAIFAKMRGQIRRWEQRLSRLEMVVGGPKAGGTPRQRHPVFMPEMTVRSSTRGFPGLP
jgi:hypothetical protein